MSTMTIKTLERRLDRLRPSRIVLLARMPDGSERKMTAPEYVEAVKDGVEMIRVLRGDCLEDVDLILGTIYSAIEGKKGEP